MPCTVSREEEIWYEKNANLKKYGKEDLTSRINETVACELARAYRTYSGTGSLPMLSEMTKKWMAIHAEEDRKREEEKNNKIKQEVLKKSALAKLTPEERKALGK